MKLFTYGTLRLHESNSLLERYGTHQETCHTKDEYIMISQEYLYFPFLVSPSMWPEMAQHMTRIVGDLYDVTEEGIAQCDTMEGHPEWYCRAPILVETSHGEQEVFAYLLTKESLEVERVGAKVISCGDWARREETDEAMKST
jgi:gamma-glutamylcyclotransferase (GGCT)/AIG2-like uncharacterized protein YtfP